MYEDTGGLWPRDNTTEANTEVLGRSGDGAKGREVLLTAIKNGERSDQGAPGFPYIFSTSWWTQC